MTDPKELIERGRASLEGVTEGPWEVSRHQSGSTNVILRSGDCWTEHGPGMLYASINLYNQGAFSDGADDDGVALERHRAARFIASARDLVPDLCDALETSQAELAEAREEIARLKGLARDAFHEGYGFGLTDGHSLGTARDTAELWRDESWVQTEVKHGPSKESSTND